MALMDPQPWVDEFRNPAEDAELEAEENRNDCTFDPTPEELGGCHSCRIGGTYNDEGVFVRRLIACESCIEQEVFEVETRPVVVVPKPAEVTGLNFRCWACNRVVSARGETCGKCEYGR